MICFLKNRNYDNLSILIFELILIEKISKQQYNNQQERNFLHQDKWLITVSFDKKIYLKLFCKFQNTRSIKVVWDTLSILMWINI